MADCNAAIRLDPHDFGSYLNRGAARLARNEYDMAIADLNESIRIQPRKAEPYANRALAWDKKGDRQKAMADCRRADELDHQLGSRLIHQLSHPPAVGSRD